MYKARKDDVGDVYVRSRLFKLKTHQQSENSNDD